MVKSVPPSRIRGSARCAMRMKLQHDTSMVVRKPSRPTSTTRPCSASFGEKAMEWTTKSSLPHFCSMCSKTASISPGFCTSSGMTIGASRRAARGSTYFFALSFRNVTASSAPKARKALAHPQAMDWSLAIPTINPLLPSRSLAFTAGIIGGPFLKYLCLFASGLVLLIRSGLIHAVVSRPCLYRLPSLRECNAPGVLQDRERAQNLSVATYSAAGG